MKLYSYWRSSASWRVRIALRLKGLPFEYVPVHLVREGGEQRGPAHAARNPMRQVPVLELDAEDGGGERRCLSQSLAILEYLEERYPVPPLLPSERWLRARVRQLAEVVNAGIQPFQNGPSVLGYVKEALHGDEQAFARHFISRGLQALEETARETAGHFLVGDHLSFADVCLVPQLYGARRFGANLLGLDTLLRVESLCNTMPAFADAHPDRQPDAPAPGA